MRKVRSGLYETSYGSHKIEVELLQDNYGSENGPWGWFYYLDGERSDEQFPKKSDAWTAALLNVQEVK